MMHRAGEEESFMATTIEPLTGTEVFAASPSRVHATLTDLDVLSQVMPGAVAAERVDDRTIRCTVRPGFSFLRASMRVTVTIADSAPPSSVTIHMAAQGIGVSMNVESRLRISPEQGGAACRLDWEARITEMKGLITAVSPGLIRAAADQVVRDGWKALRLRVEAPGL
jgi:carbon monoxide dehydrogenase subunit G